jgi:hypothetical protein
MARIMCTQKLWRRLGHTGQPPTEVAEPLIPGVALGSWAAKVFRFDGHEFVVGLNERTYLTLFLPLAPRSIFRTNFAGALRAALEDLGLPEEIARLESSALEFAPLARLANRSMAAALNDLEFLSGIELEYHDDPRRIQANLNEFPHANREPCVPREAVAKLFETAVTTRSFRSH